MQPVLPAELAPTGVGVRPGPPPDAAAARPGTPTERARPRRPRVERALGALLSVMKDQELFRRLGFVRLGDYLAGRLGVSLRTAQEWIRTERLLRSLPAVAYAFESGAITSAHVRILTRVATPETEASWVVLARRLGAKELAAAAASRDLHGDARGAACDPAAEPDDERFPFEAEGSAWVVTLVRDGVTLIRKVAGAFLSRATCFKLAFAELLGSGFGADLRDSAPAPDPKVSTEEDDARPQVPASAPEPPAEAREVDRRLRVLISERRRQEAEMAAHLREVTVDRACRWHGFASLEAYARERSGLSARQTYYLLALDRKLAVLPDLREEYFEGRLTLRQALLVGKVATRDTARAWAERAASVTLRRLEDEADFVGHLKETRPEVFELLDGRPIPEGIRLVPGRPPELHPAAPEEARRLSGALEAAESAEPLPERTATVRANLDREGWEMWKEVRERCRLAIKPDIEDWEVLALVFYHVFKVWDNAETRRAERDNPIVTRDGWRCSAPGCRSVGSGRLHVHHVIEMSRGGGDDPWGSTTKCAAHQIGLLHRGLMACRGRAPHDLVWELGVEPGREPFLVYHGERRVGGTAV